MAKVAVVTGGNRGLGFEVAKQLALKDIQVIITCRDPNKGYAAVQQFFTNGIKNVEFVYADVTSNVDVQHLSDYVTETYGAASILINNAGILVDSTNGTISNTPIDMFINSMDVNFYGGLRVIQALLPGMQTQGYGRIVNISSGWGHPTTIGVGNPAYRVSKVAINIITRMLAIELAGTGILVNSMCPGWIKTDMGGTNAPRTVEQGADTAVWLATSDNISNGAFFFDRQVVPW